MNQTQKKMITKNIITIKDHLYDLDHLIDHLIARDVFSFESRDLIEAGATRLQRINSFINKIIESKNPDAYSVFIDVLEKVGYHKIAQTIQNTNIRDGTYNLFY